MCTSMDLPHIKRSRIERALTAHYDKINEIEQNGSKDMNFGKRVINTPNLTDKQLDESADSTLLQDKKHLDEKVDSKSAVLFGLFFFLVHGSWYTTGPYIAVYYKQLGIDVERIGILTSIQCWVAILATPITGYLADKLSIRKLFLAGSLICAAIFHLGLYLVPHVKPVECENLNTLCQIAGIIEDVMKAESMKLHLEKVPSTETPLMSSPWNVKSNIERISNHSNATCQQQGNTSIERSYLYNTADLYRVFIYLLLVNVVFQIVGTAWYPLGNAEVLDALGTAKRNHYAYFKAIGGLSGLLSVWVSGQLLDLTKHDVIICGVHLVNVNYLVCFALFSILVLMAVPVSITMSPQKMNRTVKEYHFVNVLRSLFNLRYGSVILVIAWVAIVTGKMRTFDFWYIQMLGGSHRLMAWSGFISQASMITTYYFLPVVNDSFGHVPVVIFSCASIGIGCVISAFIQQPVWMIIPLFLREMTLAVSNQASGAYLSEAVESHEIATLQTIMSALTFGVGGAIGNLLGGSLFQAITPAQSYYIFGLISFAMGIFLLIIHFILIGFTNNF